MAFIKSALEIALENTKDLKVDQKALKENADRQEGKRLAGEYFAKPDDVDLQKRLAGFAKDRLPSVKEGMFEVLATRLQLPAAPVIDGGAEFAALAKAFQTLSAVPFGEKKIQGLFDQLGGFLKQYEEDVKRVEEAIRKQFLPRLKQKEQEMAARTGRNVRLDPMSDPEFAAFYKQNVGQMKAQYQDALDKAKNDLAAVCGIRREAQVP